MSKIILTTPDNVTIGSVTDDDSGTTVPNKSNEI